MKPAATRILLVEDSREQAVLLEATLGHASPGEFAIHWVDSLRKALVAARVELFQVILLDLSLPDSRGLDTVQGMRDAAKGVPIVVLSGLDDEAVAIEAVRRGADDYLVKGGTDGRSVARAIRYTMERRRAVDALQKARDELEQKVNERTADLRVTVDELQEEVAQRQAAEAGLNRANRTLRMVTACTEAVVRAETEDEMMRQVCRIAVEVGGHRMAWVGFAENDAEKTVRPVASAGFAEGYLEKARISWADVDRGRGPTGSAIRLAEPRVGRNFLTDPTLAHWREEAIKRGFQSSLALPLSYAGEVFGALTIYAGEPDSFDDVDIRVLADMASDLAFGIKALRTRDALRENRDRLRALASELTLVEQRERRRLAKVLHDHLQQLLVGARFRVAILTRTEDPLVQSAAREVEGLLTESIAASRSLTAELSPTILHESGLQAGLEWLANWMADKHGLFVELAVESDANPAEEDVKVLLFESVRELLFNVVKHARTRLARVNVRRVNGGQIQITVADNGPGFDPAAVKPVGSAAGGGFGLFSIRERLDLIRGRMDIESRPGQGARFTLLAPVGHSIPKAESPDGAAEGVSVCRGLPASPPASRPVESANATRVPQRIRVMLADDHMLVRQGLARLVSQEADLEVVGQAPNGKKAVVLARELRPDVVLMDVAMPGLNGIEATRLILRDLPRTRVIGLSTYHEVEYAKAMLAAGAVVYLTKSGPAEALLAAIRGCMADMPPPTDVPAVRPPRPRRKKRLLAKKLSPPKPGPRKRGKTRD